MSRVAEFEDDVRIIGQPPLMVELFDDKEFVNDSLRRDGRFTMPRSWTVGSLKDLEELIDRGELSFPIVGKPIRGRGSFDVKVCHEAKELEDHVRGLFKDSPRVMLEEYLAGEEATITVFPPSSEEGKEDYWASPIVTRFNHEDGVAPFNSIVAVASNSRVITCEEFEADVHYQNAAKECEEVARLLKVTSAMRVDVRRLREGGEFALFDINMKPVSPELFFPLAKHKLPWMANAFKNMTGPGRPGREDQASLTLLSVEGLGWDYGRLLKYMINSSKTLKELRNLKPGG
jgi:carbamoylphosphate synthase large subunit